MFIRLRFDYSNVDSTIEHLQSSLDLSPCLDIMFPDSSLQANFSIVVVVLQLRGKCVIYTMVQKSIDQSDDEHLHDHHLLTEHCRTGRKKKQHSGLCADYFTSRSRCRMTFRDVSYWMHGLEKRREGNRRWFHLKPGC